MRACAQCGLSVGQSATFCPVCGASADALVEARPPEPEPFAAPAGGAPARAREDAGGSPRPPGDLTEPPSAGGTAPPAPPADAPAPAASAWAPGTAPDVPGNGGGGARGPLEDIALALDDAALREDDDAPRAAETYRLAVIAYLDATDDPLGSVEVCRGLLRCFDRLSLLLERAGLTSEALEQIESAESLGLLGCRDEDGAHRCAALEERRESLRRAAAAPAFHS